MHQGVDIGAPEGAPISAAAAGKVTYSGVMGGYGNIVIVDHGNGLETRYAHASSLDVRVGETVAAGQLIARVGSTGMSTGPHLHFEVRKDDVAVEPTDYINVEHHHG
jgi:murein DD-endopeptidase MepM/ murein hydrolase activator NlpD